MTDIAILLVEDNAEVQKHNKRMLEVAGYAVRTALTLAQAREILSSETPVSAIILDIGMPDGSGLDFLRELRSGELKSNDKTQSDYELCIMNYALQNIPVLLLTGYGEDKDIVLGFKTGCDDYLPKPYTFEVLLARLERLLKSSEQVPDTLTRGRLTLKITSMVALVDGVDILLSSKEFSLLQFFLQHENDCVTTDGIYRQVWGQSPANDARQVKYTISRLRKKIENSGYTITFKRGEGYCLKSE